MRHLIWLFAGLASLTPLMPATANDLTVQALQDRQQQSLSSESPQNRLHQSRLPKSNFSQTNPTGESFRGDADGLVQEQTILAGRLQDAMSGPDPNAVRAVDGQIVIHSGKMDRFMSLHYPVVQPRCAQGVVASAAIAAQDAVTCKLLENAEAFSGLQSKLFARLNMLSGIAEVNALPLVGGEATVEAGGIPVDKRGDLRSPAPSLTSTAPDLPRPGASLLGRPTKSAIGDYQPPIPPAITAPPEVLSVLGEIQDRLRTARQALPSLQAGQLNPLPEQSPTRIASAEGIQALDFNSSLNNSSLSRSSTQRSFAEARADANAYEVHPNERIQHQTFLREPHTGITRVLTRQQIEPDPNALRNRLDPTVGERFPYAILVDPADPPLPDLTVALRDRLAPPDTQRFPFVSLNQTSFRPRLAMQIDGGQLKLMQEGLNYGFMVDMGRLDQIELNEISAGLEPDEVALRPDMREFFLNYRVPNQLKTLMEDRRRFLSSKAGPSNLPTLLSPQAPVKVGHTYLLRTVQFDAPEALTEGKPVLPSERRLLDEHLAMPGKDLLVVFQPVAERHNGNYTVLWRVLGEFPTPEMTDAANYATFERTVVGDRR